MVERPKDPLWWWKTNAESVYDDDNVTINDDALLYCAPTDLGKVSWETNKTILGPATARASSMSMASKQFAANIEEDQESRKFDDR